MRLLITGIHGFVGANLVKALSKDHEYISPAVISYDTKRTTAATINVAAVVRLYMMELFKANGFLYLITLTPWKTDPFCFISYNANNRGHLW